MEGRDQAPGLPVVALSTIKPIVNAKVNAVGPLARAAGVRRNWAGV